MTRTSRYTEAYTGRQGERRRPTNQRAPKPSKPLDGRTVYGTDFMDTKEAVKKNFAAIRELAGMDMHTMTSKPRERAKMIKKSSYQKQYKDPKVKPRKQSTRRMPNFEGKMYLDSTYKKSF